MRIVVCIKQVPDTTEVKNRSGKRNNYQRWVPSIMNLMIKVDRRSTKIKRFIWSRSNCYNYGTTSSWEAILRNMQWSANRAILITDRKFGGADTHCLLILQ